MLLQSSCLTRCPSPAHCSHEWTAKVLDPSAPEDCVPKVCAAGRTRLRRTGRAACRVPRCVPLTSTQHGRLSRQHLGCHGLGGGQNALFCALQVWARTHPESQFREFLPNTMHCQ